MNKKNRVISFFVVLFSISCVIIIIATKENSSSVLALLTLVYVLLTYYLLQSNNKGIKEQIRPFVVVTFPIKVNDIVLIIENIGKRPAYDITIKIDPDLSIYQDGMIKDNYKSFLNQSFIAPNQRFECYLFDAFDLVSDQGKPLPKIFAISLHYKSLETDIYSEKYQIDFTSYITKNDAVKPDTNHLLAGIQKELQNLNRNIKADNERI